MLTKGNGKPSLAVKLAIAFVVLILVVSILGVLFTGNPVYNKQIVDLNYAFNYAQISMPDGTVVEGKVESWNDYDDSDAVQIKINGEVYYTHLNRVVLVKK